MDDAKSSKPYLWWYRMRVVLLAPSLYVMAFCTWCEYEDDVVLFTVGPAIFLLGVFIRVWAQMHCPYRLQQKKVLANTGPYAYVRNPMYIGNTIMIAGICFSSEILWFIPFALLNCAVVYTLAIKYEEAHLTSKYGKRYLEYLHRVPRWMPHLRNRTARERNCANGVLCASIITETHNLLLLALPVLKEIIGEL